MRVRRGACSFGVVDVDECCEYEVRGVDMFGTRAKGLDGRADSGERDAQTSTWWLQSCVYQRGATEDLELTST